MCKPSCCPGPANRGPSPLIVIAAVLMAAALAGPVAAAAASLLHALVLILAITAATLAGITVLATTVAITVRLRRATIPARSPRTLLGRTQRARPLPATTLLALPRPASWTHQALAERIQLAAHTPPKGVT
jgi:hypothetical protein